jgi:dipeptidase
VYTVEDAGDADQLALDATDDVTALTGRFERAISIYRCAYSWVSQARPSVASSALGVVWFGQYAPHASTVVPLYAGISEVPKAFATGSLYAASLDASYW